jgi:cytidylate kinase
MTRQNILTIDGPSGAGKGTIAQRVATALGWHLLDSGALYRLTALAAQRQGVAFDDLDGLERVALSLQVSFLPSGPDQPVRVLLAGEDVTAQLRTETAGNNASIVAALPRVRVALLQCQKNFYQAPGLVADGRDMGTVVFPGAPFKVFLTASAEARAQRRFQQLKAQGEDVKLAALLRDIEARDARDMGRKDAPLRAADDAVSIDTTSLSIDEVYRQVLDLVRKA